MCGIVGFMAKSPAMREELGEYVLPMLVGMTERGPDSAGFAVYSDRTPADDGWRVNLLSEADGYDWAGLEDLGNLEVSGRHAILHTLNGSEAAQRIRSHHGEIHVLSVGRRMDIYKDVGTPAEIASRYGLEGMRGTHAIGHTRMATESAVTPLHAHPFVSGEDFCIVHNGSLSNPNSIRRMLQHRGLNFETDNDTEAASRLIQWRLSEGDTLHKAVEYGFRELDGFYTLLMANAGEMALVRDSFACKPAVVAETDDYVAIASEFRSLAHLPKVHEAKIYEPRPEEIYVWKA